MPIAVKILKFANQGRGGLGESVEASAQDAVGADLAFEPGDGAGQGGIVVGEVLPRAAKSEIRTDPH
jgi:hypothetical protein